jgi:hypothetical protein
MQGLVSNSYGNIRVILGTHHAHNRTLTITFRCYVIIVYLFMSAIIKSTVEISVSPTMFQLGEALRCKIGPTFY